MSHVHYTYLDIVLTLVLTDKSMGLHLLQTFYVTVTIVRHNYVDEESYHLGFRKAMLRPPSSNVPR